MILDKAKMAHDWYMKHSESPSFMDTEIKMAWQYADAMQAEANKREKQKAKDDAKSSKFLFDKLTDSRSLTKDEHGNCLHFHREFGHKKCMDCGASLEEWQPDWSQAPENMTHWGMELGSAYWLKEEGNGLFCKIGKASLFGYTGNQQGSLRKRP